MSSEKRRKAAASDAASDILAAELRKASRMTRAELWLVNSTTERLLGERPLVLVAAAAHIIGTFVRASDGVFTQKRALQLVESLIQP